ncbi:TIGR03986 family CRISPR-associated RAMP protein [candidate division KSB1 bacterium]|nr:TIGR03986 family CRISPR-associated RAMP protein [candidate division KSB1 bacterium]
MGRIIRVVSGEKVIFQASISAPTPHPAGHDKRSNQFKNEDHRRPEPANPVSDEIQLEHTEYVGTPAHAPYNFIPINEKVVEISRDEIPEFDKFHPNRNTGWIELEIETKTPLYIRGYAGEKATADFFAPNGKPAIPGSSLRGMVRTLVEIVSYSKFQFYDDKLLYYRGLADKSNLRKEYQDKMSSFDRRTRKSTYKVSAGVIRRDGLEYYIISSGTNYRQIPIGQAKDLVRKINKEYREFNHYKLANGYLVVSGSMKNKKRDWLIEFPSSNAPKYKIPEDDVRNYLYDTNRSEKVPNLIHQAEKAEVPCFYVRWFDTLGNERVAFGHTGMFRLVYEKSISDHIFLPENRINSIVIEKLKSKFKGKTSENIFTILAGIPQKEYATKELKNFLEKKGLKKELIEIILEESRIIDIAEAIFGNEKTFAGRVFFEEATLAENQDKVQSGERTPKILSGPKPTTFQHYLVQSRDNIRELNHYNTNASIRGHKLYWHKSGHNWEEKDEKEIQDHSSQYTQINPVKTGTRFIGRIRFENLTDVELGALLFVLKLPDGCFHKIGMGKPLGLGSIEITPRLFLSTRTKRYEKLLNEWGTNDSASDAAKFKTAFEEFINKAIGEKPDRSLWDIPRLKELKTMLNFETGVRLEEKNDYMRITPMNEFKDRPILPLPQKVH